MKKTYRKPSIVEYDREEIMELIGPVRTQYPCICDVNDIVLEKVVENMEISFSLTGGCPNWNRVVVQVPGSEPYIALSYPRGAGTEIGGQWSIIVPSFTYLGPPDTYPLEIQLWLDDQQVYVCEGEFIRWNGQSQIDPD